MTELHILKEKMIELMQSLSYSDDVITKTRIIADRYIQYISDNCLSVNVESAIAFSDVYYYLAPRSRNVEYCRNKARSAALKLVRFYETGELNLRWLPRTYKLSGFHAEAFEDYLEYERKRLRIATFRSYNSVVHEFNDYLIRNNISIITVKCVVDYFMDFLKVNNHPHSFYHRTIVLKKLLEYLYNKKYTSENLVGCIPKAKYLRTKELPSVYTNEEVLKIMNFIDRNSDIGKRDYAMISLAVFLGLRSTDIVNLRFENIDWQNNEISFTMSKTGKDITLPLLPEIGNAILDYLQNSRRKSELKQIFITDKGPCLQLSTSSVYSSLKKYISLAKIEVNGRKIGPHSLRHSLATRMLKEGQPLPVISETLGHSDTNVTTVYTTIDFDSLRDCALEVMPLTSNLYTNGDYYAS